MDVLGAKILSMSVVGIVSIICGLLPIFLIRWCLKPNKDESQSKKRKKSRSQLFLSAMTCFGGGIILTTSLTHMLPEVNYLLGENIKHGQFPKTGLPMGEILALCGFFMIYVVEEVTHAIVNYYHKEDDVDFGHSHASPHEEELHTPLHQKKSTENVSSEPKFVYERETSGEKEKRFQASLRGFLVVLALSLHEIFEGVALGLFNDLSSVWFLFLAISFHKYIISFCLGMQFVTAGLKNWLTVLYISTFSLVTAVGAGIGIALSEAATNSETSMQSSFVTILQGLATGTLLYVVFFEVLEKERQSGTNSLYQMGFVVLGFLAMVLFELIVAEETSVVHPVTESIDLVREMVKNGTCKCIGL